MSIRAILAAALLCPSLAAAQDTPPTGCTYDTCALRFERMRVYRGMPPGEPVLRLRFGSPHLARVVAGSDSAVAHARIFDRDYPRANVLALFAGLTATGAFILLKPYPFEDVEEEFDTDDQIGVGLLGVSVVLAIIESRHRRSANRALSNAIWWYNRNLPR